MGSDRGFKGRGSLTVEAALIMPVIMGVIVMFIYIAMYCHDKCALEYACHVASAKAVYSADPQEEAERVYGQTISGCLILDWDTDISVHTDATTVTTDVRATAPVINRTCTCTARAFRHFCPKY